MMPKLGRYSPILDSVFFLYKTRQDAEAGAKSGGTGFFVAVASLKWPGRFHVHGITNWHVAAQTKPDLYRASPCIRVNSHAGKPEIFEFSPDEWFFVSDSYDIAISPPLVIDQRLHKAKFLNAESFFLTESQEISDEIGPADDVFMVGRFVDYDGIENNAPALRFGHISIMNAKIPQGTGYIGRSIILDMNSRTGFSGSPVFVFRTLGSHFIEAAKPGQVLTGGGHYLKLLGIHWGQFPERWELKNSSLEGMDSDESLVTDGKYIIGLSGMTRVIPAACILEVLNLPELQSMRTLENSYKSQRS